MLIFSITDFVDTFIYCEISCKISQYELAYYIMRLKMQVLYSGCGTCRVWNVTLYRWWMVVSPASKYDGPEVENVARGCSPSPTFSTEGHHIWMLLERPCFTCFVVWPTVLIVSFYQQFGELNCIRSTFYFSSEIYFNFLRRLFPCELSFTFCEFDTVAFLIISTVVIHRMYQWG